MARLWAAKVSYDSVQVGDELPILVIHESQETMVNYARYAPKIPGPDRLRLNAGEKHGKKAVPGGSVDMGDGHGGPRGGAPGKGLPAEESDGLMAAAWRCGPRNPSSPATPSRLQAGLRPSERKAPIG